MKKNILFDGDGVVIDAPKMFSNIYEEKYDLGKGFMEPFFHGEFQECLVGKADLREALRPHLEEWKWNGGVDELLTFWFESERFINGELIRVIKALRSAGHKCYLVSNQEKYRTKFLLEDMRFSDVFDAVFPSCEVGYRKPQREFYEQVLIEIDAKPEDVLYFDDEQKNVDAAQRSGILAHIYESVQQVKSLAEK